MTYHQSCLKLFTSCCCEALSSHKLKKFSRRSTSKIMLQTLMFTSADCRHIQLALGALWSVKSEFGSCSYRMHWLVLSLALVQSPLSQALWFASLHSRKEGFKLFHSETWFQRSAVLRGDSTPLSCRRKAERQHRCLHYVNYMTDVSVNQCVGISKNFRVVTNRMLLMFHSMIPPSVSPGHAIRGRGLSSGLAYQFGHEMLPWSRGLRR